MIEENADAVTRAHLAQAIHKKIGLSHVESLDLVASLIDVLVDSLAKEGEVKIPLFGSFKVKRKKERMGRNPKTGKEYPIVQRNVIGFSPSRILKDKINYIK